MKSGFPRLLLLLLGALGASLTGCVYFNTYYNAQKAYDDAMRLRDKRFEKNPEDTVLATADEKTKLERCIAKSSKVLELYPEKKKYQPKALFLIGESYLAEGEYSKAIIKYEELARYYPNAREIPAADFHRAKCLFLNGQYLAARPALEQVMNGSPEPDYRREAMALLAKLEAAGNSPVAALELYEKLLREHARTPESRGTAHYEAAKLAFELKQWERARGHATDRDVRALPTPIRYRCDTLAAVCLYRLGRPADGIREFEAMKKNRLYYPSFPEIDLQLAKGHFQLGQPDKAVALLAGVPKQAPKSAWSAEAFYRLGDHQLRDRKDEKQAKMFFDSAAAAGPNFEYALLAAERSAALGRLADLRKPAADTAAAGTHYRDFMIAELFLFRLDDVDSALAHLDRIVADPRQDSSHSMRAAYARAFIQEEFKGKKTAGDSLYRYVLEKYPNTEYAKQAERNLGLKPTVQTREDEAHKLFLEAEAARFGGHDPKTEVIPAYAKVVSGYPETREAARAEFAIAMLYEQMAQGEEKIPGSQDSAVAAYQVLRERYARSPQGEVAEAKLSAAGIKPRPRPAAAPSGSPASVSAAKAPASPAPAGVPASATPATAAGPASPAPATATGAPPAASPATPSPSGPPPIPADVHGALPNPHETVSVPEPAPATPSPDTTSAAPEGKTKEVIDNGYENVDQY
jgi:tetratricopeptide (TPR) repeat protein